MRSKDSKRTILAETGESFMQTNLDEVERVRSFRQAAQENDYDIGENADQMAVGEYNDETVFLRQSGEEEAFNYALAEEIAESSSFNLRVPKVCYDEQSEVLITEELGGDKDFIYDLESAAQSLINLYGFQILIGQADFNNTNTDYDTEGAFAYDFENIGRDIRQTYKVAKDEAEELAQEMGVEQHIDDFDEIGRRAAEIASEVDSIEAVSNAVNRTGENRNTEEQIYENFALARAVDNGADPSSILEPSSANHDDAQIIT